MKASRNIKLAGVKRLGRPRAGQRPLSRELILDAALRLVDRHGVNAMSMRALARDLDVDPMAIYHYFPGKREIITGVVRLVFSAMRTPSAEGKGWEERVKAFARSYLKLSQAHPNLIYFLIIDAASGAEAGLTANESLYAALEAAGLAPLQVLHTADLVVDYVNGFALAESSGRLGQPGERRQLLNLLNRRPAGEFPAMNRVFKALSAKELQSDFEGGLRTILAGIWSLGV